MTKRHGCIRLTERPCMCRLTSVIIDLITTVASSGSMIIVQLNVCDLLARCRRVVQRSSFFRNFGRHIVFRNFGRRCAMCLPSEISEGKFSSEISLEDVRCVFNPMDEVPFEISMRLRSSKNLGRHLGFQNCGIHC